MSPAKPGLMGFQSVSCDGESAKKKERKRRIEEKILDWAQRFQICRRWVMVWLAPIILECPMASFQSEIANVSLHNHGNSALVLVTTRLRYVAGRKWGTRKYMNIRLLKGGTAIEDALEA
jgi:hypothetical protein